MVRGSAGHFKFHDVWSCSCNMAWVDRELKIHFGLVDGLSRRAGGVRANRWTDTTWSAVKCIALNSTSERWAGKAGTIKVWETELI